MWHRGMKILDRHSHWDGDGTLAWYFYSLGQMEIINGRHHGVRLVIKQDQRRLKVLEGYAGNGMVSASLN